MGGAHVGACLEALARRPCLEKRLLDEIVGKVATSGQRTTEGAKVRDYRAQLILEVGIRKRNRLRTRFLPLVLVVRFIISH